MKDDGVAWPVFSVSFAWYLSCQQPWEAVLNSHLAWYQYTKHYLCVKDLCDFTSLYVYYAVPPCSLYLWTARLTSMRIYFLLHQEIYVSAACCFLSCHLNLIKMLDCSQHACMIELDISKKWLS